MMSRLMRCAAPLALSMAALAAGCADPVVYTANGSIRGRVLVSGPLRQSAIAVEQLLHGATSLTVREHVGDAVTDDDGYFELETGALAGHFLIVARGGSFTELATGASIQLDPADGLESIVPVDPLVEEADDLLVSPIGHLLAARIRWTMSQPGNKSNAEAAAREARETLGRHFGNAHWTRITLASLGERAISPTEPLRAALIHTALSFLAQDIAIDAGGASSQEVNVLALAKQLAADLLKDGTFDGNDGNSPIFGEGLQVGVCAAKTCAPEPAASCALGACRTLCDLYAGTTRSLLAGEVTKVIQSPDLNRTGLVTGDILAVARAMSDNVDEMLFGAACVENLDRLPPRLAWVDPPPTPGVTHYVRGTLRLKAQATDDTDPAPQVSINGGPAASSMAEATLDIAGLNGPVQASATARDMAGNTAMIMRADIVADHLAPEMSLASTDMFVDGTTWWTTTSTPTLRGTVSDASPVSVTIVVPGGTVTATSSGGDWTATLPVPIDQAGIDVTVVATDAAGNRTERTQRIRADVAAPELALPAEVSVVRDEALEQVDLSTDAPRHTHNGRVIDLATNSGCPSLTKYSYLLGPASPPFAVEVPQPNPLRYTLLTIDDGVGSAAGTTQYRVGIRQGGTTNWVLDWSSAGPATRVGAGTDRYDVSLVSNAIPSLATTEGVYDIELRTTDRLGRTTTTARCFDLHLRAPPLRFVPSVAPHKYRLDSLTLEGTHREVAARLLNNDASGASLIDMDVTNGTAETVFLEVIVTRPAQVTLTQNFARRNALGPREATEIDCESEPSNCSSPAVGPVYTPAVPITTSVNTLSFPAKVFALDGAGVPTTEVPCQTCGVAVPGGTARDLAWKFVIPPRAIGGPARRFKVMMMMGQAAQLWPQDAVHPAGAPFFDRFVNDRPFTGRLEQSNTGCTRTFRPSGAPAPTECREVATRFNYRALTQLSVNIPESLRAVYRTAPTVQLAPVQMMTAVRETFLHTTSANNLP